MDSGERWRRLEAFLTSGHAVDSPRGGRLGAVLALLSHTGGSDLEIVYTRRHDHLANHPGQISFPGGRCEPGESVEDGAVREAQEEVDLDPASVTVLGRLPAIYIPPSRFWLQTIVAKWDRPHDLHPQEAEVDAILRVPLRTLLDPDTWRVVHLSVTGWMWAWQLPGDRPDRHLLWGATARVTADLLDAIEPGWNRGLGPADLATEREVQPWRGRPVGMSTRPARLRAVTQRDLSSVAAGGPDEPPSREGLSAAGRSIAEAVHRLVPDPTGVLVLAGPGGKGAVGREAARLLRAEGIDVHVRSVPDRSDGPSDDPQALPHADVIVDALVGGGLDGPLEGAPLAIVNELRHHVTPVISIDVPTGLHPERGVVGPLISADVTVAVGGPRAAVLLPGVAPFIGDLYLAGDAGTPLQRLVAGDATRGWRE